MKIATSFSLDSDASSALDHASARLAEVLGGAPHWVLVQASVGHDAEALQAAVARTLPGATVHGGSSCLGVMTEAGMHGDGSMGLGLLGMRDERGAFGTGAASIDGDPRGAARTAARRAIESAGRAGEAPALVWLSCAPGCEEEVIAGIEEVVGAGVPIVGGSTADNTVEGKWYQITGEGVFRDAVVVSVIHPSTRVASALSSGYSVEDRRGRVTRASGRTIHEIDGRPAAAVYDEWIGGAIGEVLAAGGGSVLSRTTLFPLGREVGRAGGEPYHRLAHAESVTAEGGLRLFTDVAEGEEVVLMRGSADAIVARAGGVAREVLAGGGLSPEETAGAIVIFCAGCMLTVREHMPSVVSGLNEALGGAPFLGCFTFGEQGRLGGGENRHGNLMISVTALGRGGSGA